MAIEEGDIVLVPIPQANAELKNRPVLLRKFPPFNDFLACGISTQLKQEVKGFDYPISSNSALFSQTDLVQPSLIRLGFLAMIPANNIPGKIGKLDEIVRRELLERLAQHLCK